MKDNRKKNRKRAISLLLCLTLTFISVFQAFGQSQIPILTWRTHFSYSQINHLTSGGGKVFAAAPNAIFYIDLDENSINLINKNTGLSDVGISAIHFEEALGTLFIGYENGNLDFWSDGTVTNVPTILNSESTLDKSIQSIAVNNGKVYFSGGLGVIVYELAREEITEAYQNLGVGGEALTINEVHFTNDSIYAATEDGLLSASLADNINKQDFNNWNRTLIGLSFQAIENFDNSLIASSEADLFSYDGNVWTFADNLGSQIQSLQAVSNQEIFVGLASEIRSYTPSDNTLLTNVSTGINQLLNIENTTWVATQTSGVQRFQSFSSPSETFMPSGPTTDISQRPTFHNGSIFWINGDPQILNSGENGAISQFNIEGQEWSNSSLGSNGNNIVSLSDFQFTEAASGLDQPLISSFEQGLFAGLSSSGVTNVLTDVSNNHPLQLINGNYQITAVERQDADVWLTVYGIQNSLYQWSPSTDSWTNHTLGNPRAQHVVDLFIAPNGDKWLLIDPERGGGIIVYSDSNRQERLLTTNGGQGGLPGSGVSQLVLDQNQFLWVGTDGGIAFYPNPDAVLNISSLTANVPIFENRLLLRDEFITQVAIDPANRKWFGTNDNGIWLFSDTGEEFFYHFTTENSPLPSDKIISLYVHPSTGELFVGTDKGMVSFQSDATEGTNRHENVTIYPNPVNPSFQGNVILTGLVNNALIKITDASGKLVREIRANGSTALWNSRDINGTRVKTGVYLIFSSSTDGSETYVGKLVVI